MVSKTLARGSIPRSPAYVLLVERRDGDHGGYCREPICVYVG